MVQVWHVRPSLENWPSLQVRAAKAGVTKRRTRCRKMVMSKKNMRVVLYMCFAQALTLQYVSFEHRTHPPELVVRYPSEQKQSVALEAPETDV